MLIVFIRAILIYVFLLIIMRLMGKKQLGELQPFEFAITLIVADLATIPMSDTTVPITYGIVPMLTLLVLQIFLAKGVKHSIKLRRIINGKPVIVINEQGIDTKAMNDLDMTVNDLLEAIRTAGYFTLSDVQYAIVETNGTLTVLPKAEASPATLGDMKIKKPQPTLPYSLICEGKTMQRNIDLCGFTNAKLESILEHYSLKPKDILLLTVNDKEDLYIQPFKKPCIIASASEVTL